VSIAAKAWLKKGAGVSHYQYNGKELNEDFGLDWYDYGARWYDASIGRWNAVDPLAENYYPFTGYNYTSNNPILFSDPTGMDLYIKKTKNEKYLNQAYTDLFRLVNQAEFKGKVTFSFDSEAKEGYLKVKVDFGDLSKEEIDSDAGLSLLRNVSASDNSYLYSVATKATSIDRETGKELGPIKLGAPAPDHGGVLGLNLSITDREDPKTSSDSDVLNELRKFNGLPMNGFDAHIIISPFAGDAKTSRKNGKPVPREWFTFHELQEAYFRTEGNNGKGMRYKTAHENANEKGKQFYLTPYGWNQKVANPYPAPQRGN